MGWPLLDYCASKALLSNYRKEGVFLLCIFRVQETVNRVSLLLLAEDYACLIFFTYIENCIPQILSQLEKLVCMGSSCFKDATLRSFLKLRIQQHSPTAEVRRVSEFPFAIGSRSIVYVCAQQRAKNVSKYSNILMPSRASSSYFFRLDAHDATTSKAWTSLSKLKMNCFLTCNGY